MIFRFLLCPMVLSGAILVTGCKTPQPPSQIVLLEVPAEAIIGEGWDDVEPVDFVAEVQPLLESKCLKCHQRTTGLTSLVFHTKKDMLKGAGPRPVLVPGQPEASTLFLVTVLPEYFIESMPPAGDTNHDHLTPEERAVIYHWILQGAPWPEGVILSDPASRPKVTWQQGGGNEFPCQKVRDSP